MFEQFRSHFPRGSLISELVQIDHGKYIVRATVQNEGLTLATGLAAADTVEQAEDQARIRALAVLNISISSSKSVHHSPQSYSQEKTPRPTASSQTANASSSSLSQNLSSEVSFSVESEEKPVTELSQSSQETISEPETSESTVNGSGESHSSEENVIDHSDIIARTNVELRRLQWTSEQGRKFLQETYGKRSRTLLSESELLQFLEYLEKQPTPPQQE